MTIFLKRVYDQVEAKDGKRVLVDRLWPRGLAKVDATWEEWIKDVAPSPDLRKWFAHREDRFEDFRSRYEEELAVDPVKQEAVKRLREDVLHGNLTLMYAAKSETCNHATVLRDWLLSMEKPRT